jgi:hypothetical protein
MNKQELNSGLRFILKRLEKAEKFALDQMPDICKQMVTEKKIEILSNFIISSISFLTSSAIFAFFANKLSTHVPPSYYDDPALLYLGALVFIIVSIVSIGCAGNAIKEYVYLKKCTNLFLLKEFKLLIEQ